jgi:hypothetical protein
MYYTNDLRTHLDILTMVLTIEDSWQEVRLLYALKGIPMLNETITDNDNPSTSTTLNNNNDASQSLFDIFSKSKSSYQKRAYQFVKMLLNLFSR